MIFKLGLTVATLISCVAAESTLSTKDRARVREIFQETIEIRSTHDVGTTRVAEAMAARLKAAGFSGEDLKVLGPKVGKENVVVRAALVIARRIAGGLSCPGVGGRGAGVATKLDAPGRCELRERAEPPWRRPG